ncbi:MAG: glycosyltransferase family 4 protein [Candidatus Eisenbacteria bacterium]|uniref:Glycosyltransferase family 4 protein n=1 Tax=Eiseniibacteriota bacterium TaxID=2212470 RepID=A0A933SJW1_UNCEI|nr:glycosyltransferase family 4 protein [Candidatus Eisenbacteria bacterium]
MSAQPLRITFVLPSFSPTGGALVTWRHAGALLERGHAVTLLAAAPPLAPPWAPGAGLLARRWFYNRFVERIPENLDRFGVRGSAREVARVDASSAPDADVVVATSFETAEWIADWPARCGRAAYFLQDYEAWRPELEPRVDATWRLPYERIAVSRWLADLGRERFGLECRGPVGNGVDFERFAAAPRDTGAEPVIGAVYHPSHGKGFDVLLEAFAVLAREHPSARFLVFGRNRPRAVFPARTRFVWAPAWERIPALFAEMDVFVHASRREGWGLPPMEAMASGCAVVATRTGGVPEFADESCAEIVPPGDAAALAGSALALLREPARRVALGAAAARRMRAHGWEPVFERFESELSAIASATH